MFIYLHIYVYLPNIYRHILTSPCLYTYISMFICLTNTDIYLHLHVYILTYLCLFASPIQTYTYISDIERGLFPSNEMISSYTYISDIERDLLPSNEMIWSYSDDSSHHILHLQKKNIQKYILYMMRTNRRSRMNIVSISISS